MILKFEFWPFLLDPSDTDIEGYGPINDNTIAVVEAESLEAAWALLPEPPRDRLGGGFVRRL